MSFLHFHGSYNDTKHPAKLFCLILQNKGIMAIFAIFEIDQIFFDSLITYYNHFT